MNRLVLLGASNVRRAFPTIVATALADRNGPIEVFGAFGHGRSYGARSCIPGRCLPGILECGIWKALAQAQNAPTLAVVTDVGNDILYGRSAEEILRWVSACVERLRRPETRLVVTGMPIPTFRGVSRPRYLLFRNIFFPSSRIQHEAAIESADQVDSGLRKIADVEGARLVWPKVEWYGIDPIHIRRRAAGNAWGEILGSPGGVAPLPRPVAWRLLLAPPEHRWLLGVERRRAQPALRLKDGTTISLF